VVTVVLTVYSLCPVWLEVSRIELLLFVPLAASLACVELAFCVWVPIGEAAAVDAAVVAASRSICV